MQYACRQADIFNELQTEAAFFHRDGIAALLVIAASHCFGHPCDSKRLEDVLMSILSCGWSLLKQTKDLKRTAE